jgi:CheY-like chemotaxis protein
MSLAVTASPSAPKLLLIDDDAGSTGGGSGAAAAAARETGPTASGAEGKELGRVRRTPTTAAIAPSSPVSRVLGARVLVVDDSEANRRFAGFIARKLGCAVTAVGDGDEVVGAVDAAAAAAAPFDVVLMDLVMVRYAAPRVRFASSCLTNVKRQCWQCAQVRMNGDTALAELRAAGYCVPVAAVTANATPADAARYQAQGFAGVLGKPFTLDEMHALLTRILCSGKGVDAV